LTNPLKRAIIFAYRRHTIRCRVDGISSSQPNDKFSWKTLAEPQLSNWISEDRFDFFSGSHDGYLKNPSIVATNERSILFLKNDYWIMRDFIDARGEHDYALNFYCAENVEAATEAAKNGGFCVGETAPENGVGWRMFAFGDNGGWRKSACEISKTYGGKTDSAVCRFVSQGVGAQEFFTFLLPAESFYEKPEVYETNLAGGRAFVIANRGYLDLFVFTDGDQIVRTEFFNTDFKFTWARMGAGDEMPRRIRDDRRLAFHIRRTRGLQPPANDRLRRRPPFQQSPPRQKRRKHF
jgi:hypothetical protein